MHNCRQLALLSAAFAALAVLAAPVTPVRAADGVTRGGATFEGPSTRYLLGGDWLFRLDREDVGVAQNFQYQVATDGWKATTIPNAWNAGDDSPESMIGTVGWYRKDFRLPDSRSKMDWIVRFESVNYRAKIWLNGKPVGRHTGAFLPFELRLTDRALKRNGVNRLVVRVDNRRGPGDFPPSGFSSAGDPTGGWWNYGGLLREVYLRRVDKLDIANVLVRPRLRCAKCTASVLARVTVRSFAPRKTRVSVSGNFGNRRLRFRTKTVGGGRSAVFEARVKLRRPRLWSPDQPRLYRARFTVRAGGRKLQGYKLRTGVRSLKITDGRLRLNGRLVHLRGAGLHEDDKQVGFALDNGRRWALIAQAKELGATVIRAHYPLHSRIHELADSRGLLVWSEVPVYNFKTSELRRSVVRRLAVRQVEENIITNRNHPSILVWSFGNELASRPGSTPHSYFRRAAKKAKRLDPGRPVGLAINGYPAAGCRRQYGPLDVIGVNNYFGWYLGPGGQLIDRNGLGPYLDQVRRCYPRKAIIVSEFGAEANRPGPVTEKGTFEFQQDFVRFHLAVYASKPWLSGALYWALREFRVRPGWAGGNPLPSPPFHKKGLLDFDGAKKPAWFDAQANFKATNQLGR